MARLSMVQLAEVGWNAGFRGVELNRFVSVAMAESGGRTDAVSSTGCCHGITQINIRVHGGRGWTVEQARDPNQNARMAYTLWKESGWRPWDSSRGGQLLWRLPAENAVAQFMTSHPSNIPQNLGSAAADSILPGRGADVGLTEIATAVKFFTVGRNWARIGEVALGAGLLFIALNILARPVTQPIIKKAVKVL